jgi:lactoylglutathione lyase
MKLGYVISYVSDVEASVAFYEKAFGLQRRFVHESGQYAEMETGATALAFANESFVAGNGVAFRANRPDAEPAGLEIALVTRDVKAAYTDALKNGAAAIQEPREKPWGQIVAYVCDLNGVLVELCSPMGV